MFEPLSPKRPLASVVLKRICVIGLSGFLIIGAISAYRAWFQVKSVDLKVTGFGSVFRPNDPRAEGVIGIAPGSTFEATVASYARTYVDVKLELIQGGHAETLLFQTVPGNEWGFFDPRGREASFTATLTEDILKRFNPGAAQLRATATGRPQWMRLPPPLIRNTNVIIQTGKSTSL